jgi:drug/metabolite transporter (DMT)-like permease
MKWLFVMAIVAATVACDYLQASAVKKHGEIEGAGAFQKLFGQWRLPLSIVFMALSFFSFTQLLAIADLSFAVPATAMTIPAETFMARFVLGENVDGRRWAGALLVAAGVVLISF